MRVWTRGAVTAVLAVCAGFLALAGGSRIPLGLPEGAIARLGLGRIRCVTYSPDGKWLAVGTSIRVELREADTLELAALLTGHTEPVLSVAFSPDGSLLASGSWDGTIKLWNVATGEELRTLTGHTGYVYSVAFSPDGKILASGSDDGTVLLWDVEAVLGRR
ncbi:PD40 domain-containing protein [Candidatus Bipolaricaulota bacterium]|nr:PD40 domain-containing protein [Candidatus Bipolaricaulota bacterium]